MSKEVKGILLSRLIVLISIILVPIATFLIYNLAGFELWFSDDRNLEILIMNIICPTVFSVSWVFFLILFAERFAKTLDDFDKKISVVPSRLKFFYGINALYILFIFIFPLITPVIAVLSFASFAWRLTTFRKKRWEEDTKISLFTWIMMGIFALIPLFCSVVVLPKYFNLAVFLWHDIWRKSLNLLFSISYSLFTALAIGSLIILIQNSGISEYEQIFAEPSDKRSYWNVKILELFLFGFFLFLDLNQFGVIHFFYILGFIIIIITSVVNFFRGKSKYHGFKSHLAGYIIAAVFIGSNVIYSTGAISEFLKVWSLVISAALYIFVLFYTFLRLE